jgi:hypothetical protein
MILEVCLNISETDPEDGSKMFLRNSNNLFQNYMGKNLERFSFHRRRY